MRFVTCLGPDGVEEPAVLSADGTAVTPVSYTHLDVYKRQAPCRSARFMAAPRPPTASTMAMVKTKLFGKKQTGSAASSEECAADSTCLLYTSGREDGGLLHTIRAKAGDKTHGTGLLSEIGRAHV